MKDHLVYYKATTVTLHFLEIDFDRGQATEIAKQDFIKTETIKEGAKPLFHMMSDGTLVTYHYLSRHKIGKQDDKVDYGIFQTFDIRSGERLLHIDQGIMSGLSECFFLTS